MYLKTLTLKGFKSFASATTLELEPGVTAVVGPNGSGKSNVVDALAWVMGEQGAKSLRGGKMEDVIFAGTAGRPALGRAEVSLTIDNTDGALPIDYTEVTISRIMFRSGGSDYAINGSACRLLDVQELLSDSGIGREMHVIVGQGRLDSILHATAEERRGFIEEAAGVLKHRKRKEKALRKLDGLGEKLSRLQDLATELRRQLKPLGRQAEVARRAAVIQADVRDARLRLLADDYITAVTALEREVADEEALLHTKAERESDLLAQRTEESQLQAAAEEAEPLLEAAEDIWNRLTRVSERLRGLAAVAAERRLVLDTGAPPSTGRNPEQLRSDAARAREEHAALAAQVRQASDQVAGIVAARTSLEDELGELQSATKQQRRQLEHATAAVGRAGSRVSAAEAGLTAREAELGRAREALTSADEALAAVGAEETSDDDSAGEAIDLGPLQSAWDRAKQRRSDAAAQVTTHRAEVQQANREQAAAAAREETLAASVASMDANSGSAFLAEELSGVLGTVADLVTVGDEHRTAVVAAMGALAEGLVVADPRVAAEGLAMLRERGVDRAELVIAADGAHEGAGSPATGRRLADTVEIPGPVGPAVAALLADFVLVADLAEAVDLVRGPGRWIAVTPHGDLLASTWARGGVRDGSTRWDMQDAVTAAGRAVAEAADRADAAQAALDAALEVEQHCAEDVEQARTRWQDARTRQAASDERRTQWQRRMQSARAAVEASSRRLTGLESAVDTDRGALQAALQAQGLAQAELDSLPEPDNDSEPELIARLGQLRQTETEARMSLHTLQERAASQSQRAASLQRAAEEEERSRERAARQHSRRVRRAEVAAAVAEVASAAQATAERDLAETAEQRRHLREAATQRHHQLTGVRTRIRDLESQVARLTDSVHRDEVARAEQRLRIEQLAERALTEHGISTEVLVDEYGPDVPIPPSPATPGDAEEAAAGDTEPYPYERRAQERRLRAAERSLSLLGTVNPLALEEFAAAEERSTYLNEQIEDMKRSRHDLQGIVKDIDARVEQVFAEAFVDAAAHFERVFARLFPGGEGRLVLTDPHDMLVTGVEVEARPPGKKIKRLSLLSGGERSLTAVAFLIALFKARPSPFYVLDEVEAALDDTNLGRLIDVIEELRTSSQLIIITHQKRTMEAADALYGVAMRSDGVTEVISQRLSPRPGTAPVQPDGTEPVIDLTGAAPAESS